MIFTKEQTNWLIDNYPNLGLEKCVEYLKMKESSVKRKILYLRLRLNKDKYKESRKSIYINKSKNHFIKKQEYIEKIDWNSFLDLNDETIYLLGYIWADGHLRKSKSGAYSLIFSIAEEDGVTIEHIADKFGYIKKFKKHVYQSKRKNEKPMMHFAIYDWELGHYLYLLDFHNKSFCEPNKLLSLIPEDKHYLFFLGYSDGDGHINRSLYHFGWQISAQGTQTWTFLENQFKKLNIEFKTKVSKTKKGSTGSFLAKSKKDAMIWCGYLYQKYLNNGIGLKRKRIKYEEQLAEFRKNLLQLREFANALPEIRGLL